MIQVILAEDHNIVRNGIRMILEIDKGIHIAAEAVNGREVLEYLSKADKTDVVLADVNMPELDGLGLLKEIKARCLDTKVVILSMHDNEKYISEAFINGAAGYLLKSVSADELIFALKHVHNGGKYLCSELAMKMFEKSIQCGPNILTISNDKTDFSAREIEVLHLIAEGLTNNEISDKLFISKRTVEGHRQSLLEKTASRNTAALIRYAVLNGFVQ
ncbi:DNA-binding NarL/FixJ family response regulator [Pedobacter africanus]|uniref:DNA-binding NarL/FixJ family response regulator n=1 Tax=Pedobacter africanus TaxID=151894 RepID=A0ACC6KU87_9SPHI|nr:response regulator transcription factor [Pedobacter africanus]MDR6782796.1 DNA-binding NarL/FixJ family response regulator [Pedobacter africanus]